MIFIGHLLIQCISAFGNQNTINRNEIDLNSLKSFPMAQSCQGSYVIDAHVKEAILVSSSLVPKESELYSAENICIWHINAVEGRVIRLRFDYFYTECFWDTVTIFDGPDNSYPIIGSLCGNRDHNYGYADIIVSSGNYMTIFFQSDTDIQARGFRALSQQIDYTPMNSTLFTPRMFHSSAYDPVQDIVYNTFGLARGTNAQNDMILYFPQNDSFVKRDGWSKSPTARYSHFSWFIDSKLIVFGGIRFLDNFLDFENDIWSYDPVKNAWKKLESYGYEVPPGLENPAAILVASGPLKLIYVFGGRYKTRIGLIDSRTLYSYNLNTGTWKTLAKAPASIWGATITYHKETETLRLIGGYFSTYIPSLLDQYPSYQYSIKRNSWNTETIRDTSKSLVYSSAQTLLSQDYAIIFGGMYVKSISLTAPLEDCFSNVISIYNFACESFSYHSLKDSEKRAGHSIIIRNSTILVFGGSDGILKDTVLKIPLPLLNKNYDQEDTCKNEKYCKSFSTCYDCLSKPYCGWCPDKCVLDDFSLITDHNNTAAACPQNNKIENSISLCPIANNVQLNLPFHHTIDNPTQSADFEVYVDSPTYDLLAIVSSINPPNTVLNITLPYLDIQTVQLSDNAGILLPSTDLRRTTGIYYFRVTPFMGSIRARSLNSWPISFTITFRVAKPGWIPHEPENAWTNLDIISMIIMCAISLTLSITMTILIVRARRRLLTMRNWQNRTEYAEEVSSYKPELYSVVMSLPVCEISKKDISFGGSKISIGSQKKYNDHVGWFKSLPKLIRRLTASHMDIGDNNEIIYPLSVEKMPSGQFQNEGKNIVGVSYLVVNPGYKRSVHSGSLPNVSIGTSLHLHNSSHNRLASFLSLATIRNRTWGSMLANYFHNNNTAS